MATGVPFNWKEMTPVAMLALDQFVLWTNADKPYKTAKEYIDAVKAAGPANKLKMGGTGSKQEDQIITAGSGKSNRHQVHLHSLSKAVVKLLFNWLVITLIQP
jgi:putative tricarboxylic transport membrane protein